MHKRLSHLLHDKDMIGSLLLMLFGFSLPLSVAVNNLFAALIIVWWIYRRSYALTWHLIKHSKVTIAILLFVLLHAIGLLWTEDMAWGWHMLGKEWKFLLIPIMMTFVQEKHIRYYISAFLLAMTVSEVLSYLIWLECIPPFLHATVYDPTPFMHHTSYNPLLAFAIYLVGYLLVFEKSLSRVQKIFLGFFFITMSVNMFITGGRAGQVGYIVIVLIFFFQFFNAQPFRALFFSFILLGTIFSIAYSKSQIFHDRMNLVIWDIKHFQHNKNTSVGLRINFAINTCKMIEENPLFGVGTGDFKQKYIQLNKKYSPLVFVAAHPHNMYLLEMSILGIFGLLSLLYILYAQFLSAWQETNDFKSRVGKALPLLFFVLMFSDAYLLGHFTTMLFIYFSSFLYRPDVEYDA